VVSELLPQNGFLKNRRKCRRFLGLSAHFVNVRNDEELFGIQEKVGRLLRSQKRRGPDHNRLWESLVCVWPERPCETTAFGRELRVGILAGHVGALGQGGEVGTGRSVTNHVECESSGLSFLHSLSFVPSLPSLPSCFARHSVYPYSRGWLKGEHLEYILQKIVSISKEQMSVRVPAPASYDLDPPNNNSTRSNDPEIEEWKRIKSKWAAVYLNLKDGDAILYKTDLMTSEIVETYIIRQTKPGANCIKITMNDYSTKDIQVIDWIKDESRITPAELRGALNAKNIQSLPKLIGISVYNQENGAGAWNRQNTPIYLRDIKSVEPIECPRGVSLGGRRRSKHRRSKRRGTKRTRRHK